MDKYEHAFLSPSNPHWLNYTPEKLIQVWRARTSKEMGIRLHAFAHESVQLGIKLRPESYPTVALYVNDCIDFGMSTEVRLTYDDNCFGTADALLFAHNTLHIWDLKTGVNRTRHAQIHIYAALFCLQHEIDPYSIVYDLRIYQHNKTSRAVILPSRIEEIMEIIKEASRLIEEERKTTRY